MNKKSKPKTKIVKKMIEIHEPLGCRILVKVDVPENVEKSTLILVKATKDREFTEMDTGMVIDIGESAFIGFGDNRPWVKVGDKVAFLKHAGAIRVINDEDHRVLNDNDLLTKITFKEIEVEEEIHE
jgi:co-chaperonin GroES (HSP10)